MNQNKQPEALRLADICAKKGLFAVEDELRRLHAESEQHMQELRSYRITVENREARIAELEKKLGAARHALPAAVPDDWRDQFSESVYEDLSAADNQDVPLEEYPARILNILDAIVGPRHPTVIKWRNDAIRSCIAIAYKYCSDPESHRYLKQDLEAMLAAPAHHAEGVQPSDKDLRDKVARALGCGTGTNYAWSYLLKQIESLVECEEELIAMKQSTHSTTQGLDAQTIKHISALSELVRMPNAEYFSDAHNAAVRHLRAIAAQAKQGEPKP